MRAKEKTGYIVSGIPFQTQMEMYDQISENTVIVLLIGITLTLFIIFVLRKMGLFY